MFEWLLSDETCCAELLLRAGPELVAAAAAQDEVCRVERAAAIADGGVASNGAATVPATACVAAARDRGEARPSNAVAGTAAPSVVPRPSRPLADVARLCGELCERISGSEQRGTFPYPPRLLLQRLQAVVDAAGSEDGIREDEE